MGLTRATRLLLEKIRDKDVAPVILSLVDVAAYINKEEYKDEILARGELELNANLATTEALLDVTIASLPLVQTVRIPDQVLAGVPTVVDTIVVPTTKTGPGNVYKGVVALTIINTTGGPADITGISIVMGDATTDPAAITFPTRTLAAGATDTVRIGVEIIHNTALTASSKWISGTADGVPVTMTAPPPNVYYPVTEGALTFGLLLDLDAGVNVTGPGFFEIEAYPGTIT